MMIYKLDNKNKRAKPYFVGNRAMPTARGNLKVKDYSGRQREISMNLVSSYVPEGYEVLEASSELM